MEAGTKREQITGHWRILVDPENVGVLEKWFNRGPSREAESAFVPGIIQQSYPGYHGVAWYWLAFESDLAIADDERAFLVFEAVDYYAEVWLDGARLGDHEGGELPFELEPRTNCARNPTTCLSYV